MGDTPPVAVRNFSVGLSGKMEKYNILLILAVPPQTDSYKKLKYKKKLNPFSAITSSIVSYFSILPL